MSIDLSLHRIEVLLARFEPYTRQTVHIAGTNGKGSVCALLASIFRHAGLSVGRFNSPHLLHPSDSISLDGVPVSRDVFSEAMEEVRKKNEDYAINASSFEVLTVCALLVFERARVDVVLLEVGMGGRLDATNVIPDACILASVITAIDLDHQAFLGPTVKDIAWEKAGIIRKGKPVVLAVQNDESVYSVVKDVAKQMLAPLVLAPVAKERDWDEEIDGKCPPPFSLRPFVPPSPRPVEVYLLHSPSQNQDVPIDWSGTNSNTSTKYQVLLPLHGKHQLGNLGAALTVLHVLQSEARINSRSKSPDSSESQNSSLRSPSDKSVVRVRLAEMDERAVHIAVHECDWPGRLSFHLYYPSLPCPPSSKPAEPRSEGVKQDPLVVLVDGAHNAAAARTLSDYVYSLLSSLGTMHATSGSERTKRVRLTFILALSHSPPKTPASVLVPLLEPFVDTTEAASGVSASLYSKNRFWEGYVDLKVRVAFVRFSPPEGMPWVTAVPPSTMQEVVRTSFPSAEMECWTAPDSEAVEERGSFQDLRDALLWAAEDKEKGKVHAEKENLVLVAGSLYLAADFYRLLHSQEPILM